MFYRRDLYEKAGVDPGVDQDVGRLHRRRQEDLEADRRRQDGDHRTTGDDGWFRTLANQEGCSYFSNDGKTVTINQKGCVDALEMVKKMMDAGMLAVGDWGEQDPEHQAGTVASAFYGGWYEGTIRSNAPEHSGQVGRLPDAGWPSGARAAELGRFVARHHLDVEEPGSGLGLCRIRAGDR